jgi:putative ABC transport system ATP-binding protein
METFIQVRQLKKTFLMGRQKVNALNGVDVDIPKGAFTVIMGPSGSGKSTFLYLLGGLDRASSGSIVINGQAIENMDENHLAGFRNREMGFIFQSYNLVASMSALDNVIFPMRFAGIPLAERKKRALDLLRRVGLENRSHHKPTELSGGQQQRVAIARSLVNNPPLILADEPTGNLDTQSGFAILKILVELHRAGHTVVLVTHDPRLLRFATQTIYILDGEIVTAEAYEKASQLLEASLEQEEGILA